MQEQRIRASARLKTLRDRLGVAGGHISKQWSRLPRLPGLNIPGSPDTDMTSGGGCGSGSEGDGDCGDVAGGGGSSSKAVFRGRGRRGGQSLVEMWELKVGWPELGWARSV